MQINPATDLAPLDVQLPWLPAAKPGKLFSAADALSIAAGSLQRKPAP